MQMKNRSWYLLFLLFWVVPALACSGGTAAIPTATAFSTAKPKATATKASTVKATATKASTNTEATATTAANGATTGEFGAITFSVGILNDEKAIDPLETFPDGVTLIYASFDYSGMTDGETYRTEWKRDGQVQPDLVKESQWKGGESGTWWVSIYNDKGIHTGEWQLDLYIGDTLQQSNKLTVEPNPSGQPDFGPIVFATDKTDKDAPVNPLGADNPVLPDGTTTVYAFFDGIDVPKGTAWTSHWFHNGESASNPKDHSWDFGANENDWISFGTTDGTPLESGTYELKLTIGSTLVNVATYIMP
jgi:hypothetical protein